MVYVVLYAYAQPYKMPCINLLKVFMLVDILLLLMIPSTKVIVQQSIYLGPNNSFPCLDLKFGSSVSFDVNQCGQVTAIDGQAAVLTSLYYFPLVMFLVLIGTIAAVKFMAYYNKRYPRQKFNHI